MRVEGWFDDPANPGRGWRYYADGQWTDRHEADPDGHEPGAYPDAQQIRALDGEAAWVAPAPADDSSPAPSGRWKALAVVAAGAVVIAGGCAWLAVKPSTSSTPGHVQVAQTSTSATDPMATVNDMCAGLYASWQYNANQSPAQMATNAVSAAQAFDLNVKALAADPKANDLRKVLTSVSAQVRQHVTALRTATAAGADADAAAREFADKQRLSPEVVALTNLAMHRGASSCNYDQAWPEGSTGSTSAGATAGSSTGGSSGAGSSSGGAGGAGGSGGAGWSDGTTGSSDGSGAEPGDLPFLDIGG